MTDLRSDSDAPGPVAHAPLEQCAPYLWGDLDPQDEWEFERHLGTCVICLDECDRLGPLVGAFSGLTTGEVAGLLTADTAATPGGPPAPSPVPVERPGSAPDPPPTGHPGSTPTRPPRAGSGSDPATVSTGPAAVGADGAATATGADVAPGRPESSRPAPAPSRPGPTDRPRSRDAAGRGPAGREPDRVRRGRRRWLVAGTLAMVAAVSLGVTLGQRQQSGAPVAGRSTVNPVNAGVTVEGVGASARLSVTVSARTDRPGPVADVRATVIGLTAGVEYRLYAVAADTRTYQVAQWTATTGPQEVTGEIAVAVDTLAFFAVAQADGTAVVSARIGRPTGPR
ncbi:hypothetical protein [Micromonospora antibiotica]|uniref:Zinc-finger domain-containing protein n=1 Tax=Micromonospora antibiotica TaxID=2807623 RepID=A0ABS3V874_9ACTN|nr:hypothetical protein [Micromonospora antibiotica]MBO4161808.1 hypothetical protein [Micromonospora antibiotica]